MRRRPPRAPCGQLVRRDPRRRSRTPGLSTYPGKGRRSMPDLTALLASVDAAHDEIVMLLQDLVRIPTINTGPRPDTGGETRACELLRPKLDQAGIQFEVHESAPGRGNLIARLGPAGGRRLLFMSHTDVVPVEDETLWEHPPFSATIDRGRVYGRGADDDKADVAAQCMALVLLARAGVNLGGELIYLAAADEESGGRWGAGWVADHLPDKVRADVAINEGGGVPVHTPDGLLYEVCTGEKGRLEAHITRQGRSGHASRPWAADNPVPVLAEAIQRIAAYEPEIDVSHPFFREVLQAFGVKHAPTAENIDRIADRAKLVCDVRALPGQDDGFVQQELEHILGGLQVAIDVNYTAVSNSSPADAPFVDVLRQALGASLGSSDFRLLPAITAGFTDSRFLRPLGTQVYGFSPHHPSAEPVRAGVHGNNEFMEISSLMLRTKYGLALACLTLEVNV